MLDFPRPLPAPAALSRYRFDAALVAAARAAGVEVLEGYRVKQVILADGAASGVSAAQVNHPGQCAAFRAPVVIAADGRRSLVVRDTGRSSRPVGPGRFQGPRRWTHADGKRIDAHHALAAGGLHWRLSGRGGADQRLRCHIPAASAAIAQGIWHTPSDRGWPKAMRGRRAAPDAIEQVGDSTTASPGSRGPAQSYLDIGSEPAGWLTMPEVAIQRSYSRTPGVLYVGDAMGTIEPLTGQGMTMALASARLAAGHLLAGNSAAVDRAGQLAYERAWHAQFAATIRASRWMGWLLRHPRLLSAMIATGQQVPGLLPSLLGAAHRRSLALAAPR